MITFIALGYNIRLFVIGPFSFIKELDGWKIKIKLNNIVGLGGIVLPNITELRNEEQFFNVRKDVAKAMITAPIFSAFQCVISLFLALGVTPLLSKNIQSTFFTVFITSFFITMYINITSCINMGGAIGDYKAYRLYKKYDGFAALALYDDAMVSMEKERARENCYEAKKLMIIELEKMYEEKELSFVTCSIINIFLYEHICCNKEIPTIVEKYISYYVNNLDLYYSRIKFENYYVLLIHILFYISEKDINKARSLWDSIKKEIPQDKVGKYYISQITAKLYGSNEKYELCNKNEIRMSVSDSIMSVFENYYDDELKINHMICQ